MSDDKRPHVFPPMDDELLRDFIQHSMSYACGKGVRCKGITCDECMFNVSIEKSNVNDKRIEEIMEAYRDFSGASIRVLKKEK